MSAKKHQLDQLNSMRSALNSFIESFKNDEVVLLDGRMSNEINTDIQFIFVSFLIVTSIDFIPKEPSKIDEQIDICAEMTNRERK